MSTNTPYSSAEIDFLRRVYPNNGIKVSLQLFNEHFGANLTESQIKHRVQKFGIKSNNDGKFKKGCTAWNKGMVVNPRIYTGINTQFKKGIMPKNTRPIGAEKKTKDGVIVKIAMPDVWKQRSRVNYENANCCQLNEKDKILHLDGNCYNDDPSNLVKVNDSILGMLNKKGLIFKDGELTRCAVTQQMILQKIKEIEKGECK